MKKAPYYIIPDIDALATTEGEERKQHVRRIAAAVGDVAALRRLLGIDPEEFAAFYPDMLPAELSTEEAIDAFIHHYVKESAPGHAANKPRTVEALDEGVVPLPAPDFDIRELEAMEPISSDDSTSAMLDSFLNADKKPERKPIKRENVTHNAENEDINSKQLTEESSSALSETLARTFVKKGNYAKALEIITDLSLKNPKKSVYFADQIRFLKKLILNQTSNQGIKQ